MAGQPGIDDLASADYLALTAFVPSASRIGRLPGPAAVWRFYEGHEPDAATVTLASEAFGRSRRLATTRIEVLSHSMPVAILVVDRPHRVARWLRPLVDLLPTRLMLMGRLWSMPAAEATRSTTMHEALVLDPDCHGSCSDLVDCAHAQGLPGAWALVNAAPKRWSAVFSSLSVAIVGEQQHLARTLQLDRGWATLGAIGAPQALWSTTQSSSTDLGGCTLTPWTRIRFTTSSHTRGGATRHQRVVHQLRTGGGPGATTFSACHGYVRPASPRRARLLDVTLHAPITTVIATDAQRLALCLRVIHEVANAADLITCEPVHRVSRPI
jgi:PII-like signaling protein